jgi:hypothetical protein
MPNFVFNFNPPLLLSSLSKWIITVHSNSKLCALVVFSTEYTAQSGNSRFIRFGGTLPLFLFIFTSIEQTYSTIFINMYYSWSLGILIASAR